MPAERGQKMINKFMTVYAGHIDIPDHGQNATPANDRRYSNHELASVFDKTEAIAKVMDELGYDTLWLAEHHFQHEGYERLPNILMLAVHLAHITKQLRIGCGFNIAPMWHPLRLAEDYATTDILTKGRTVFGVGRGYHSREVETFGATIGARAFEGCQHGLGVSFEGPGEFVVGTDAGFDDDKGLGLDQTVLVRYPDHSRFEHILVCNQRRLDLGRRDIHAAHLQHVVAAAAIDVITVLVLEILVPGARPYAVEGGPAALAVVPVTGRTGRAADQEVADFAAPDRPAFLVNALERIAGGRPASGAVAHVVRPVAEKDMQQLGRTDAVEDVDADPRRPAPADLRRQGLAGRDAAAQRELLWARQVVAGEHRNVKGRHAVEDRCAVLAQNPADRCRGRPLRHQDAGGADCHRKG